MARMFSSPRTPLAASIAVALTLVLVGCGGGGSGVKPSPPAPATPPPTTPPPTTPPPTTPPFATNISNDTALPALTPPTVAAPAPPREFSSQQLSEHLRLINAAGALGANNLGQGMTIGLIDSGVDRNHPALSPRVTANIMPPTNWTGYDRSVDDKVGHGTVVAMLAAGGMASAQFSGGQTGMWQGGVAQGANIASWRLLRDERPVDDGTNQGGNEIKAGQGYGDFYKALNGELADAGAKIINNSWGGLYWNDPALSQELATGYKDFIVNRGGLIVFASGNSGDSTNPKVANNPADSAALPALHGGDAAIEKGWLTVGALDPANPTQLTGYSQKCGYAMNFCLVAPGDVVYPLKDATGVMRFYKGGGTSYAAPLVSGALAVVWAKYPWMTNDQVRQIVLGTAKDLGDPGVDNVFGWGLLDVTKASQGPGTFAWGDFNANVTSNAVFGNSITGAGGLRKDGQGVLTLTAPQLFTGRTIVSLGGLDVRAGLASALQIDANGRVYANGIFGGGVSNSGVFFNDQQSGATVNGSYTQAATGNLGVWLGTPLKVQGTANIDGKISILGSKAGYTTTSKETLLNATGGVTGTFKNVAAAPNVFLDATIGYDANNVFLNINRISIVGGAYAMGLTAMSIDGATRVEAAMNALDGGMDASGNFRTGAGFIQQTPDARIAERSLSSLSGRMHAATTAMTFEGMEAGRRVASDRFEALVDRPALAGSWAQDLRRNGAMANVGNGTLGFDMGGWMMGRDMRFGQNGVLGMAFSRMQGSGWMSELGDRSQNRQTEAQAYAGWIGKSAYLRGGMGLGRFDRDVERNLQLGLVREGVRTLQSGRYAFANVESGYRFDANGVSLTPYIGSQYANVHNDGFAEDAVSGFGLRTNGGDAMRWQAYTGLRASNEWRFANGFRLGLDGRAEYQRMLRSEDQLLASFNGLEQWLPVAGYGVADHSRLFGLGVSAGYGLSGLFRLDLSQRGSQYGNVRMFSASYRYGF